MARKKCDAPDRDTRHICIMSPREAIAFINAASRVVRKTRKNLNGVTALPKLGREDRGNGRWLGFIPLRQEADLHFPALAIDVSRFDGSVERTALTEGLASPKWLAGKALGRIDSSTVDNNGESPQHDLDVEQDAHMIDIIDVEGEALLPAQPISPMNLG